MCRLVDRPSTDRARLEEIGRHAFSGLAHRDGRRRDRRWRATTTTSPPSTSRPITRPGDMQDNRFFICLSRPLLRRTHHLTGFRYATLRAAPPAAVRVCLPAGLRPMRCRLIAPHSLGRLNAPPGGPGVWRLMKVPGFQPSAPHRHHSFFAAREPVRFRARRLLPLTETRRAEVDVQWRGALARE